MWSTFAGRPLQTPLSGDQVGHWSKISQFCIGYLRSLGICDGCLFCFCTCFCSSKSVCTALLPIWVNSWINWTVPITSVQLRSHQVHWASSNFERGVVTSGLVNRSLNQHDTPASHRLLELCTHHIGLLIGSTSAEVSGSVCQAFSHHLIRLQPAWNILICKWALSSPSEALSWGRLDCIEMANFASTTKCN
jgi:hypothetical protein